MASLQSRRALSQSELFKWHCARLLYNTAGNTHLRGTRNGVQWQLWKIKLQIMETNNSLVLMKITTLVH